MNMNQRMVADKFDDLDLLILFNPCWKYPNENLFPT